MATKQKEICMATVKGIVGEVPMVGSLLAEYLSLVQNSIEDKRLKEWYDSVNSRLASLEVVVDELAKDDFFYNCFQETMFGYLKSYEEEKRNLFVNALTNCTTQTLSKDKKMRFIRLLDTYTINGINLLKYFSSSHIEREEQKGTVFTTTKGGSEKPYEKALKDNLYLENDIDFFLSLAGQFANDGLLSPRDIIWEHPVNTDRARGKKTSKLGDEFLEFIEKGAY